MSDVARLRAVARWNKEQIRRKKKRSGKDKDTAREIARHESNIRFVRERIAFIEAA